MLKQLIPQRAGDYAWIVAGITFIALIVTAAVRATPSILIVPLEQEFGWSRVTISFAISINLLLYGLIGPFAAGMLNRYGSRRVMMISLATLSGGVALTTLVRTSWQLVLLWGVLVGTGTGMTAIVLGATVVHRWFREQQGLVIGVLTASTATRTTAISADFGPLRRARWLEDCRVDSGRCAVVGADYRVYWDEERSFRSRRQTVRRGSYSAESGGRNRVTSDSRGI